jgi:hypothetical protein
MTSFAVETNPRAVEIDVTDDELIVHLADGRTVSVPLAWFPRLLHASAEERANVRIIGDGEYINWPTLDEDLSISGLLRGTRAVGLNE